MAELTAADLLLPLGVDRAFDQSAMTHDVDFAHRRLAFGRYLDGGAEAGVRPWRAAGIPYAGYLFMRPRAGGGDDPVEQAEVVHRRAVQLGCSGIMLDVEWDRTTGGTATAAEVQAAVDHLATASPVLPMIGYWSQGTPPRRSIRGLLGVMLANYSYKPRVASSAGAKVVSWQFTSRPWDRSVWLDAPSFSTYFGRAHEPVRVPPSAGLGDGLKERWPMFDPVPTTLHRVVDLLVGTVLRAWPSTEPDARQSVVTADPHNPESPTQSFGYVGKALGITGWTLIKNGGRYVYVRTSDVLAVRTKDVEVVS